MGYGIQIGEKADHKSYQIQIRYDMSTNVYRTEFVITDYFPPIGEDVATYQWPAPAVEETFPDKFITAVPVS